MHFFQKMYVRACVCEKVFVPLRAFLRNHQITIKINYD